MTDNNIRLAAVRLLSCAAVLCLCIFSASYGLAHPSSAHAVSDPAGAASSAEEVHVQLPHPLEAAGSAETQAPEPEEEPAGPEYFTFSMIGDCTLASSLYNEGLASSYSNTVGDDYAYPFALTREWFENDDFTIANLECVLSNHTVAANKNFVFRAVPEYVNILTEGGVDFVTLGNNHVLDYGEQGYADTKAALDGAGISYAGRDEWTICQVGSLTVGVYAVSFGDVAGIQAGIQALKDNGAEFIIACLHWGDEGSYTVNALQTQQGHAAIDAGADIVMGSHPHTLQPCELYNGHYIYYSMGNWSFGGNTNPRDKDTVMVRFTVERLPDGSASITTIENIPCSSSGVMNGNNYQPVLCEEGSEQYERVLSKLNGTFNGANLSIGYEYGFNEY